MTDSSVVKFSLKATSSAGASKKRPSKEEEEDTRDYVTGFEGNELLSVNPQKKSGPAVIPLALQGQTKRSRPTPAANTETSSSTAPPSTTQEGSAKTIDELAVEEILKGIKKDEDNVIGAGTRLVPLTVANQIEGIENITDEEERFKYDVESRPDEADVDAYEEMPIDEFGFAMLRGMGWAPGTAIGLNNRGLVEPIEFVKRAGYRLGLGATPADLPVKSKKYIKPGESREPEPIMVAPTGPDGKVRHVKGISEKLVPLKKGLQPGQLVGIVSGPHEGLYAHVLTSDDEEVVVRLASSSEEVVVPKSDVSIVDQSKLVEGHPALKFMIKEKKERERERDESEEKDQKKDKHSSKSSRDYNESTSSSSSSSSKRPWLRPHIMVRIVSKSFHNGKYYNKKVRVVDVVGRDKCIVQLDNGNLVEEVKQRMLETVIPPAGSKVMVLAGADKGRIATLLERKKSSGDDEKAVIQMLGDLSIENYDLDDVAQYVGTFDEEAVDLTV